MSDRDPFPASAAGVSGAPGPPEEPPGELPDTTPAESPDPTPDEATRAYLDRRPLLFSIVYDLLGTIADTEDVLQETWLAWSERYGAPGAEPIASPQAYLIRIAVTKALARRSAIERRRETYIGPWLPEPLLGSLEADATRGAVNRAPTDPLIAGDGPAAVERAESVSMAMLVVLETLSPLERAVFVLHEVFGYAHAETARILDRSPAAIRQLAHRAREHVQARRPRFPVDLDQRRRLTERFAAAAFGGDLSGLLEVLAPDVTLWCDGGGKAPAAGPRPLHGRDRVANLLASRGSAGQLDGLDIRYRYVGGDPAAVVFTRGGPFAVLVVDVDPDSGRISTVYAVTNPDKLTRVG